LLFITYVNDLLSVINILSRPIIFVDDTSEIIFSKNFDASCTNNKMFVDVKLVTDHIERRTAAAACFVTVVGTITYHPHTAMEYYRILKN
jgi:hypothetical protein